MEPALGIICSDRAAGRSVWSASWTTLSSMFSLPEPSRHFCLILAGGFWGAALFCGGLDSGRHRRRRDLFPFVLVNPFRRGRGPPGPFSPCFDGAWIGRDIDLSAQKTSRGHCAVAARRNFLYHRRDYLRNQKTEPEQGRGISRTFPFFCSGGHFRPFLLHLSLCRRPKFFFAIEGAPPDSAATGKSLN